MALRVFLFFFEGLLFLLVFFLNAPLREPLFEPVTVPFKSVLVPYVEVKSMSAVYTGEPAIETGNPRCERELDTGRRTRRARAHTAQTRSAVRGGLQL